MSLRSAKCSDGARQVSNGGTRLLASVSSVGTLARVLLLSLTVAGCTSIQWRDAGGVDHHVGLFFFEVLEQGKGTRLSRTSFGVDVRLSGKDPGISIGLKTVEGTRPDVIVVKDPGRLGTEIVNYLKDPGSLARRAPPRRGLFYLREDISREITLLRTTHFGIEWTRGIANPGLSIGYSAGSHFLGQALEDGIVQIHIEGRTDLQPGHLTLWRLELDNQGVEIPARGGP